MSITNFRTRDGDILGEKVGAGARKSSGEWPFNLLLKHEEIAKVWR